VYPTSSGNHDVVKSEAIPDDMMKKGDDAVSNDSPSSLEKMRLST
jgi:hypothetical protein